MNFGHRDALVVTRTQQVGLTLLSTLPNRSDGVNNVLCLQVEARSDFGQPGLAAAQSSALIEKSRARRAMNRAVHSTATQQRFVGGVDYRVNA